MIILPLVGCNHLPTIAPVVLAGASAAGAFFAKESLALSKKDQEIAAEQRQSNAEDTCVARLRGSIDQWPSICSKTTLTKMDACGRAGFESTPLCSESLRQYVARTQSVRQPEPQQVNQNQPVKAEKKAVKATAAKKPKVSKAVAKKQQQNEPQVVKASAKVKAENATKPKKEATAAKKEVKEKQENSPSLTTRVVAFFSR